MHVLQGAQNGFRAFLTSIAGGDKGGVGGHDMALLMLQLSLLTFNRHSGPGMQEVDRSHANEPDPKTGSVSR
jgi:hypothetical protein